MKLVSQTAEGLASMFPCECGDHGCPVHQGTSRCTESACAVAYRIDMEDETGTPMCAECAADAADSGVFRIEGGE